MSARNLFLQHPFWAQRQGALAMLAFALSGASALAQDVQTTTTTYQYDLVGNVTQSTDPLGRKTDFQYDSLYRTTLVTQPAPVAGAARPTIRTAYNWRDDVTTVTDPRSLVTRYTVDGLGNQTALASPDTGTRNHVQDVAGNIISSTDARGRTTTFSYDALNRLTRIGYASGTPSVFEYDGQSGATNSIGKLTRITDESGQTTFAYDAWGRLLGKTQTVTSVVPNVNLGVSYAYGTEGAALGKIASVTYPSGNRINYIYDAGGRVSSLTLNPAGSDGAPRTDTSIVLMSEIGYAPFGPVQGWKWGNHVDDVHPNVYTRSFDLDGRISGYPLGSLTNGGVQRTVNYDSASRITSITHTGNGTGGLDPSLYDQAYSYDDLDRLTGYLGYATSQGYSYDASGNRTQLRIGTTAYNNSISASSNRLSSTTGPTPAKTNSFDLAGNLTGDGTFVYTFGDNGRLTQSAPKATPLLSTSYRYNAFGQRVAKASVADGGEATLYAYDEQGQLLGEYSADAKPIEETVYLDSIPVAVLKTGSQTDVYNVYADHLGAPRVITAASDDTIAWRWDAVDPFGLQAPYENPTGRGIFTYNQRFPGQVFDRETNTHYNYFRDYDPQTGRYVESDPLGLIGGVNTYAYVGANPLSAIDPLGLQVAIPLAPPIAAPGQSVPGQPRRDPYSPLPPSPGPSISDLFKPSPYLPTWDFPDWVYAAVGKPKANSTSATLTQSCSPNNNGPCDEIRKKIRDLEQKLASKERQMSENRYDLFNRAYDTNPGGDLAGKGTWVGHLAQIEGLRVGLERARAQARAMGCL
ncbi:RHS repeat-associated core domain-containing protein [Massilia horti]|uniref:RHS repeat protein n=1 Tax=Massilia horti TaxID=2562153 RepID=A0A4Y9SXW3_9BURK|nr:RHS repeat-associated core domain-containing protein [Massilia horti]TFW30199.1 RHS repeat protein [Massilia horti]